MNDDTGTDRVELTEDEREALNALHERALAADRVSGTWSDVFAPPEVLALIEQIKTAETEAQNNLTIADALRDENASANQHAAELMAECEKWKSAARARDERVKQADQRAERLLADRDAARAELAAANASATWEMMHRDERIDALQATLDRVVALADEWEESGRRWARETGDPQDGDDLIHCAESVRAALTPEGTE